MQEGEGPRQVIEQDITAKILTGENLAYIHLPARDTIAYSLLTIGGRVKNLDQHSPLHIHADSFTRSVDYLRDALGAHDTQQAFGMLVARGLPFPQKSFPSYKDTKFSEGELEVLRMWVEGKANTSFSQKANTSKFYRMRQRLQAASNIQVVAVAIKEGFLRPERQDDGSFLFGIDSNPHRQITEDEKEFLKMRFLGMSNSTIKKQRDFSEKEMTKVMRALKVETFSEAILYGLQSGQLDLDELVCRFDATVSEFVLKQNRMREILEKTLEILSTDTNELAQAVGSISPSGIKNSKERIKNGFEVTSYLQAVVVYLAAVQRGLIPPYKEASSSGFPSAGVIYAHDQQ